MSICVNLIPDSHKQEKGEAKVSHCGRMDLLGWKVSGKVVRPGLGSGEALGPTETTRLLVPDAPTTGTTTTTVLQHTPLIAQRRVLPAGSAQKDALSHWLHLFDFSPLCVFKCAAQTLPPPPLLWSSTRAECCCHHPGKRYAAPIVQCWDPTSRRETGGKFKPNSCLTLG